MKDYEKITNDDLKEFREANGNERTIEEMEAVIQAHDPYRSLLHKARMWGWGDTEVRDEVYVTVRDKTSYDEGTWG